MPITIKEVKDILGSFGVQTGYDEGMNIFNLVEKISPKAILEIGISEGGSLKLWSKLLNSDGLLIGVDAHNRLKWNLGDAACKTKLIIGYSALPETVNQVKSALEGRQVDFLRIDGDHEYVGVRNDFLNYGPLVRKNGIVMFHDYISSIHVNKYIKEISVNYDMKYIDCSNALNGSNLWTDTAYFVKEKEYDILW